MDGWRGAAILVVLAGHFSSVGWFGFFGVELFFVLSGCLMAYILVEQQQPIGTFIKRRMVRILPALYIYLASIALLHGLAGGIPTLDFLRGAAASALFFANYLVGSDLPRIFQHTWSLAV